MCSEDALTGKPHPAPLQLALKRLRRDPEHCVYVGDTAEDIEMARSAGVRAIGVLGPFPTAARLRAAKPEVLLNSVAGASSVFAHDFVDHPCSDWRRQIASYAQRYRCEDDRNA